MTVFVANFVATVLVIYPSVALATCIVVLYKADLLVHNDS